MRKIHFGILTLAIATLFLGCSSNDKESSNLEGSPAAITTAEEASNTLTTITSLSSTGSSAGDSLAIARAAALSVKSLSPSLTPSLSEPLACAYGGTITYEMTSETSYKFSFDDCDNGYTFFDGSMKGSGDKLTFSNLTIRDSEGTMKINMTITDINNAGTDVTMDGTIAMSDSTNSASFGYEKFHVITRTNGDINMNGDVSIKSSEFPCNDGTFAISTIVDLTPYGYVFSSGTMKVNGVKFEFISSTQMTITFANGTTETVAQGLDQICTAN